VRREAPPAATVPAPAAPATAEPQPTPTAPPAPQQPTAPPAPQQPTAPAEPEPFAATRTREHQRVDLKSEISFESETNFYVGWSGDISAGGIFIATHELMEKGSVLRLRFQLPNGRRVHATGEVMWIKEFNMIQPDQTPGMGIRFTDIDPGDLLAVTAFTKRREPIFYDDEDL